MCGIVGYNFQSENDILDITALLKNRGPDNTGTYSYKNNHFGHRRLKIIDISEQSNQPMIFDNLVLVYNGEIYNYKELIKSENLDCKTNSDSEVLIRLYQKYGYEFLNKLNGAFAFTIYDIKNDLYFCARDRYGKKPFYYYANTNKFIFSSLIKPIIKILNYTPKLNKIALSQYLQYFTPLSPNTFYSDIYKIEPASYLVYKNNAVKIKKYYKIQTKKSIFTENEAINSIENILLKSVEQRLVGEAEVGSLLSGGMDSSLISSMYQKISNKKIKTFSVGYEKYEKYSELDYAKQLALSIGSEHTEIKLAKNEYLSDLDEVLKNMEEPHGDPSSIPLHYLMKNIKQQGIKTVLSGEGSDELFLGYDNYSKLAKYYEFQKSLNDNQNSFLKEIIMTSHTNTKEIDYLKRLLNKQTIYNGFGEIFTIEQKKKLFKKVPSFKAIKEKSDAIDWMSYIDMKVWIGEVLLSKVDKISMSHGIETRNPFLDVNLVNLAFKIDGKLKLGDTNKYLLKKVAKKYIPDAIINRTKKGFNSPYNEWLHEAYKDELLQTILKANEIHDLFDKEYIKEIYLASKNNKQKQHLYALWNFSKWYLRTYL